MGWNLKPINTTEEMKIYPTLWLILVYQVMFNTVITLATVKGAVFHFWILSNSLIELVIILVIYLKVIKKVYPE